MDIDLPFCFILSFFPLVICLHMKDYGNSWRSLAKVADYKIIIEKTKPLVYTINSTYEREFLWSVLSKAMKDQYKEKYKSVLEEVEFTQKKMEKSPMFMDWKN